jgi:tRNA(Ile)-lysidine synthase
MPVQAPLGLGRLLRPLLNVERAALAVYARHQRLDWIEDPSNRETDFDRNLLRHRVLPVLRERWPAAATTLARAATNCADAAALLDDVADGRLASLAGVRPKTLSIARLLGLAPPLLRTVLRRWLVSRGFSPPSRARLARIIDEVLPARADADPLVAWSGCEVRRYRDDLFALPPLPTPIEDRLAWDGSAPLVLPAGLGVLSLMPAAARSPVALEVSIGMAAPGVRCRPPGQRSRSLKQLFQEAGIPPWLRPHVPLIRSGGTLAAVAGVAGCAGAPDGIVWRGHAWTELDIFRLRVGRRPA